MKVNFLKVAEAELDDAVEYYEREQKELGFRFQLEVARALSRVQENPQSYQSLGNELHRCLVYKFPFGIIYRYNQ